MPKYSISYRKTDSFHNWFYDLADNPLFHDYFPPSLQGMHDIAQLAWWRYDYSSGLLTPNRDEKR